MKDNGKLPIEMRPYDALTIMCFLREYVNDKNKHDRRLAALHEAVDAYETEVYKNITPEQVEKAILESQVNDIAGRHPERE